MNSAQKKSFMISRLIITIITFIIFNIIFVNEDVSFKILSFIFSIIIFILTFPSSLISNKLLIIGDIFKKRVLKVLYYSIVLPFILFVIIFIMCFISMSFFSDFSVSKEFGEALGQTLFFLFIILTEIVFVILPFIQTLLVLLIKNFIKE